jgi:hypothetical protein
LKSFDWNRLPSRNAVNCSSSAMTRPATMSIRIVRVEKIDAA